MHKQADQTVLSSPINARSPVPNSSVTGKPLVSEAEKLKTLESKARTRLHKRQKTGLDKQNIPLFNPSELEEQIREIAKIRKEHKENCLFATDDVSNQILEEPQRYEGLLGCVNAHLDLKTAYARLGALVGFAILYVTVLFLQQDVTDAFAVESRRLTRLHAACHVCEPFYAHPVHK